MDKDNKNALSEAVGRVLQETQQAAAAAAEEVPMDAAADEPEATLKKESDATPETDEEAQVLSSIASVAARRRAIHSLDALSPGGEEAFGSAARADGQPSSSANPASTLESAPVAAAAAFPDVVSDRCGDRGWGLRARVMPDTPNTWLVARS